MKTLRIIFCILSCICVAACIPVGFFFGWAWFVLVAGVAVLFGGAMFFVKKKSEPQQRSTDFMNTDAENEDIKKENEKL